MKMQKTNSSYGVDSIVINFKIANTKYGYVRDTGKYRLALMTDVGEKDSNYLAESYRSIALQWIKRTQDKLIECTVNPCNNYKLYILNSNPDKLVCVIKTLYLLENIRTVEVIGNYTQYTGILDVHYKGELSELLEEMKGMKLYSIEVKKFLPENDGVFISIRN